MQQIGKALILIMQSPPVFFFRFHSHLLITGLIQNPTRFLKALINVNPRGSLNSIYECVFGAKYNSHLYFYAVFCLRKRIA